MKFENSLSEILYSDSNNLATCGFIQCSNNFISIASVNFVTISCIFVSRMPSQKNILVLYTELAYYTVKCFSELAKTHDVNIHILRLPVNKAAPFDFSGMGNNLHFYDATTFNTDRLEDLYKMVNPNLIYCAGWTNSLYLNFCKSKKGQCKTLLGFDTPWNGGWRQIIGAIYARFAITPSFNYCFVPGKQQALLANKMGFSSKQIVSGAYSSDNDLYSESYRENSERSKVLLFVGRYAKEKGISDLCEVFLELKSKGDLSGWQLWCVGVGDYKIPVNKEIRDLGFKQPHELKEVMKEPGIFILPSTFEPWGVVVHEFAAAGFPMICSDKVGSAEVFVQEGKNGFLFKAGNKADLSEKIKKMCNLNPETLKQMSRKSYELSQKITPATWAQSLYNLIK